jgi:hypothetical protein
MIENSFCGNSRAGALIKDRGLDLMSYLNFYGSNFWNSQRYSLLKLVPSLFFMSLLGATSVFASDTVIQCKAVNSKDEFYLWPQPYLKGGKQLCFDISGFKGNGCVGPNGNAAWSGISLIFLNGESFGREDTDFRIREVELTNDSIRYLAEWGRQGVWRPLQKISLNRLDGSGVSWSVTEHGGTSIACTAGSRKF